MIFAVFFIFMEQKSNILSISSDWEKTARDSKIKEKVPIPEEEWVQAFGLAISGIV